MLWVIDSADVACRVIFSRLQTPRDERHILPLFAYFLKERYGIVHGYWRTSSYLDPGIPGGIDRSTHANSCIAHAVELSVGYMQSLYIQAYAE